MSGKIQQRSSFCSSSFILASLLAAFVVLVVMTSQAQADDLIGGEGGGELTAMVDAIKYLQGLDKVYGQAARPR